MRVKKVASITIIICLMIALTGMFVQAFSSDSLGTWSNKLLAISKEETDKELLLAYESWATEINEQNQSSKATFENVMEDTVTQSSADAKNEINQYLYVYKVDLQNIKKELTNPFHSYEKERKEELNNEMEQEILSFLEDTLEK